MGSVLIGPDSLEADAVVPQCLDNQYVPDEVFDDMLERGVDYRDRRVAEARRQAFATEFIRSLVYSSQVVIQRAFFANSDFLHRHYLPENGEDLRAFASLVRDQAVIPYLFDESALDDKLEFDTHVDGDRALKALLAEVGPEVTCVRLGTDDASNKRATESMATAFGAGLVRLQTMSGGQRNAMAGELFAHPERLQDGDTWKGFNHSIDDLAGYAFRKAGELRDSDQLIRRSDVYRDLLCTTGADGIVNGRFRKPGPDEPFLFELKKFVDLVYNTNLPDHLKRHTFTPLGLPSRLALQDDPGQDYAHDQISGIVSNGAALEAIRRTFQARAQQAMSLPLLRDLSIADVCELRRLPEWTAFKDSQTAILRDPLHCLDRLDQFQREFDAFQRAMSAWYRHHHARERTEDRYSSFVSLAVSVAGKVIIAGSSLGPAEQVAALIMSDAVTARIPRRVKGFAAKLLVGVFDVGKHRLDADRTYSIELMQSNAELTRDDVTELLASISRKDGEDMPREADQLADQGTR